MRRRTVLTVLTVTGVAVAALGTVFIVVGLENADRIASTVGALAGIAGLGLSALSWSNRPERPAAEPPQQTPPAAPKYQINARRVQGAQFGDGTRQENTFSAGLPFFRRRRGK
jgi:hypothetical protein